MAGFDEIATITYHEALGARFRVAQAGNGPDIVWLPGGDSPAHYWADQFEHFHGDHRCTAYDPRGVGETTSTPPPWTMKQFGADCAAIIEAYCNPPVILSGLSMGALITQQVAIDFPHLVRLAIPTGNAAARDKGRRRRHERPLPRASGPRSRLAQPSRARGRERLPQQADRRTRVAVSQAVPQNFSSPRTRLSSGKSR